MALIQHVIWLVHFILGGAWGLWMMLRQSTALLKKSETSRLIRPRNLNLNLNSETSISKISIDFAVTWENCKFTQMFTQQFKAIAVYTVQKDDEALNIVMVGRKIACHVIFLMFNRSVIFCGWIKWSVAKQCSRLISWWNWFTSWVAFVSPDRVLTVANTHRERNRTSEIHFLVLPYFCALFCLLHFSVSCLYLSQPWIQSYILNGFHNLMMIFQLHVTPSSSASI